MGLALLAVFADPLFWRAEQCRHSARVGGPVPHWSPAEEREAEHRVTRRELIRQHRDDGVGAQQLHLLVPR